MYSYFHCTRDLRRSALKLVKIFSISVFGSLSILGCVQSSENTQKSKNNTAEQLYASYCASCHGPEMLGALGPSLVDDQWRYGSSDEDITHVIKNGVPKGGMPAWGQMLSDKDIRALIILLRERADAQDSQNTKETPSPNDVHSAAGHTFTLKKVAELPQQIWSMAFLSNEQIIATQRNGELWLLNKGKPQGPIKGTPDVWFDGQGGLLEVAVHPEYQTNGWIYLTLSDPGTEGAVSKEGESKKAMTKVVRGKIRDGQWQDQQIIFSVPQRFYSDAGVHFGSRLVFSGNDLYLSVGDRGKKELAQDIRFPNGKIHRVKDDGSIPKDNPFSDQKDAIQSIWSLGHRNPQGLDLHPITGDLWEAEHGPRGGDEINHIQKGVNYGWPVITYGMNYDGTPMTELTAQQGMEQPLHYWVPSIAVSEIDFYTGDQFPQWKNQLLVGSLAKQELHLLTVDQNHITNDQILFKNLGRIRDVANGPDGYPYVVLNNATGAIYRLEPSKPPAITP